MTDRKPPRTLIRPDHPLIILQTSPRFDEPVGQGREAVRVWRETVPDDLKPFCQLQVEYRVRDHAARYDWFRRLLAETELAQVPTCLQIADPHDPYTFDPVYAERLLEEFDWVRSIGLTETRFEHYTRFNVPRYATPPHVRYAIDVIHMCARLGRHVSMSYQDVKWMHIAADELNQPLMKTVAEFPEYCLPQNEHLGMRHLVRQTSTWGVWIAGLVENWGVEPQSWWYENARFMAPGLFGFDDRMTRGMPRLLYRAMILEGVKLGATVFQFEPYWDLFDYDNSRCWREVICPTLRDVIERRLIPQRKTVLEKAKIAYHLKLARDIRDFHENLREIDFLTEPGNLARAAYGFWNDWMMHELVPNTGRYYYVPILPVATPPRVIARFERVFRPGEGLSEAEYRRVLDRLYAPDGEGTACITSVGGHTFVMQSRENLYERQTFDIELPRRVRNLRAVRDGTAITLTWDGDRDATGYRVRRIEADSPPPRWATMPVIAELQAPPFRDNEVREERGYVYGVTARTSSRERVRGTVNYLDYLVFDEAESPADPRILVRADGETELVPVAAAGDDRPERQVVFPTFEGVEPEHRQTADEIVRRIEAFRAASFAQDWRAITELYSEAYEDPNGYHREYAGRAWKWWFQRMNANYISIQIRRWHFDDFDRDGTVRVRMFSLMRGVRWDDQPFGYGYDGLPRIPRDIRAEVEFTWARDADGAWRLRRTDPAFPNLQEMLTYNRGTDQADWKPEPGTDD